MRVALCSFSNPYKTQVGGAQIHLLLLERALRINGIDVRTVYYDNSIDVLKSSLVRYATVFLPRPLKMMERYKSRLGSYRSYLRGRLSELDLDIVHAHDVIALDAIDQNFKKVLTIHGYLAREMLDELGDQLGISALYSWAYQVERNAVAKADHIIAVDSRIRDYVLSEFGYPSSKISVVYNAVDTHLFVPVSKSDQGKIKKMLGFDENDFVILIARRLVKKNGVVYAVKSMKHVPHRRVRMVIAGEGPEKNAILREAKGDNRVVLVGALPHDKIVPYFKAADVVMIPSITSYGVQEATSLAALEGMSCGKLIICTDIGGLKEIVSEDTGMIVEERKLFSISEAICRSLRNETNREEIGMNAREYVLKNHSYVAHGKKVVEIYKKLV